MVVDFNGQTQFSGKKKLAKFPHFSEFSLYVQCPSQTTRNGFNKHHTHMNQQQQKNFGYVMTFLKGDCSSKQNRILLLLLLLLLLYTLVLHAFFFSSFFPLRLPVFEALGNFSNSQNSRC